MTKNELTKPLHFMPRRSINLNGITWKTGSDNTPYLKHFLQPDSIVPGLGAIALNRYIYSFGNPINNVDSSGHFPIPFDEDSYIQQGPDISGILNPDFDMLNDYYFGIDFSDFDIVFGYMYEEMMSNIHDETVINIQKYHDRARDALQRGDVNDMIAFEANALFDWANAVKTGGRWDHKWQIDEMLGLKERNDYYFSIRGDYNHEWYYDIWSNIHYGFVGSAAGFNPNTLQTSANLGGIVGRNDYGDILSTQIGIDLWTNYGENLTKNQFLEAILNSRDEYLRLQKEMEYTKEKFLVVYPIFE